MMDYLDVYLHEKKVGVLASDKGRMAFTYSPEYLNQSDAEPLAYTLPLSAEPYSGGNVVSFFSNLLPDESVRIRVAEILNVSPENIFGLLKEIGEDCAGAVALFSPEKKPLTSGEMIFAPLSEDDTHDILSSLSDRPLNVGAEDFHISGAGAQDKLVASVQKGKVYLPLKGTPSTHIIKPGIQRFPESVFNELYCMKLAKKCGIATANCDVLYIKDIPYYVTERYDRSKNGNIWTRLHQEDFCQLLGYEPSIKYESEGGPKLLQCFKLLYDLELPANDRIEFLDRIIFIFLIGNGDAHAKNFSVLYQNGRPRLAPAYDLLSTVVYPDLSPKLAMKIDNEYNFRWITHGKMLRMGVKAGFTEKIVVKEILAMQKKLDRVLEKFTADMQEKYPADIYNKIHNGIIERMKQILPQ
ncbi:MAG: type II toxin-antitoxin system HipA family toxin [Lentisphaeria bacterium]|nr:type II toxin-antitoxin system HipA family toxin [Lentisphaeria bacterium]